MMSDARKTPETDSAENRLEQILQHPERASDSAGQLRDRLVDLIFSADEESFDPDALDALLAELDQADPLPEGAIPDPRKSLEEFHRRLDGEGTTNPVGPDFHSTSKKIPGKRTFRKLFPIAAILVLLVCLMMPTASGETIAQEIGRWTLEQFQLTGDDDNYAVIRNRPLAEGESKEYATPQEMLEDFGIDAKILPNWVPERLGEPRVWAENSSQGINLFVDYDNGEDYISIYAIEMLPKNLSDNEKDFQDASSQKIDNIIHHVIVDKSIVKMVWENGDLECHITGNLSLEEMEKVLYSIYKD